MFHPNGPSFFELAHQALSSTQKGYDLLASKFDFTPFRTPRRIFDKVNEVVAEGAPYQNALDLCCGTGAAMQMMAAHCHRLVGIDFSAGMLRVAENQLADLENKIVELKQADVLQYDFQPEFDLAVSFGAFGHILAKDEMKFIKQVHRCLVPGGRFVFVTTTMPGLLSRDYWLSRGFNAAMRFRNWIIRPPFVMYYLTFLWPDVGAKLEQSGFRVRARPTFADQKGTAGRYMTVIAEKTRAIQGVEGASKETARPIQGQASDLL